MNESKSLTSFAEKYAKTQNSEDNRLIKKSGDIAEENTRISVVIEKADKQKIEEYAREMGASFSIQLRAIIKEFIRAKRL